MSFPVNLSASPVQRAFREIDWGEHSSVASKLGVGGKLTKQESALLKGGEDNVIEYMLGDQIETAAYVNLLLRLLDQVISKPKGSVSKIPLDAVVTNEDTIQELLQDDILGIVTHYCVAKLCEVINGLRSVSKKSKVTLASTFYPDGILIENWRPLLRMLVGGAGTTASDAYAQRGAAYSLACLLLEGRRLEDQSKLLSPLTPVLESFVSWMASRLQSSATRSLSVVTPSLTVIIVDKKTRSLFDSAGGIGYLSRHLKVVDQGGGHAGASGDGTGSSTQQLYELCYCLWLMSYDCDDDERIRNHFYRDGAVPALVDLVAAKPREKVVRVALATLRKLSICQVDGISSAASSTMKRTVVGSTFLQEMVGCGLPHSIELMKGRKWSDEDLAEGKMNAIRCQERIPVGMNSNVELSFLTDIISDLDALHKSLLDTHREMTRWDVYEAEVISGHLQWSIIHTEKFFKENAKLMEGKDGNFEMVKVMCNEGTESCCIVRS